MLTQEEMDLVDQNIRDAIFAEQERVSRSDRSLGSQAFGFLDAPHMKIQSYKGNKNRKPQQVRVTDLLNLCESLGLKWDEVIREALKAVKAQGK